MKTKSLLLLASLTSCALGLSAHAEAPVQPSCTSAQLTLSTKQALKAYGFGVPGREIKNFKIGLSRQVGNPNGSVDSYTVGFSFDVAEMASFAGTSSYKSDCTQKNLMPLDLLLVESQEF